MWKKITSLLNVTTRISNVMYRTCSPSLIFVQYTLHRCTISQRYNFGQVQKTNIVVFQPFKHIIHHYICLKQNYIKQYKSLQTNTLFSGYRILKLTGFVKKGAIQHFQHEYSLAIQRWFSEKGFLGPSLLFFVF